MKTKIFSAVVLVSFLLATAVSALADPQNYGLRTVRITSKCTTPPTTLPDVPPPAAPDANCPKVPTITQSPSARWSVDISWFDPNTQKFYLADRNNFGIDIIDTNTDQVVGFAGGFVGGNCPVIAGVQDCTNGTVNPPANSGGPNGVLTTTNPSQLWAGDGNGTVKVFSLDANGLPTALLKSVSAGGVKRADEMAFDPDDHLVLAAWDDDADLFVQFISVSSNPTPVGSPIKIPEAAGCGIEQPVYNHHLRKFFVAIPCTSALNAANHNTALHTNGEIAVIDPTTKSIVNVFGVDGTLCFPHGLALGPRDNLLLGCSGDAPTGSQMRSIIMSAIDGSILQTFTQLGGSDEVWYNPGDNHYYLAMSSWTSTGLTGAGTCDKATPPVCQPGKGTPSLGIINAGDADGDASWVQNIPTTRTSHSVAAVYALQCEENNGNGNGHSNGKGKSKGKGNSNGNNGESECEPIRNRVYVPLTTTSTEPGGIGVYGQIP
jgi:hypothetical protein